jgi:hypothetical protein
MGIEMADDAQPDLLADFYGNPKYEERVVILYDVLGWRNHIKAAGQDAERVGRLRRLLLRHSRMLSLRRELFQTRVSTFSDNIVITQVPSDKWDDPSEKSALLILQWAFLQIAAAMEGFLLRGGVTIGDIVHDNEVVFGPGLNRAYQLESEVANYPRFIVDEGISERFNLGSLPVIENGVRFLDPFRVDFCDFMLSQKTGWNAEGALAAGLPPGKREVLSRLNGFVVLKAIVDELKTQIRAPVDDRIYEKVSWLFDRVAKQLGVPRSNSYPRVYP